MDACRPPVIMHSLSAIYPHIQKLPDDVLWAIFMMNTADPYFMTPYEQEPLLETARFTSQVCSHWRNIILNSPSLWGRLINFDALIESSDTWRNEVLRRTGTSMLWIFVGTFTDLDKNLEQLFIDLCDNHWERVEKIAVDLRLKEEYLGWMRRASPNLLSIKFPLFDTAARVSPVPGPMFSAYAPKLLHFQAGWIGCVPRLDWMMNLRELCLDYPYNLNDILDILQHMKLLESLSLIRHIGFQSGYDGLRHPVHLPRLCRFEVEDCLEYIRCIKPAPGCSLQFTEEVKSTTLNILESCRRAIAHMLQDHNTHNIPTFISLNCSRSWFNLSNCSKEGERYIHWPSFKQSKDQLFKVKFFAFDADPQEASDIISLLFKITASPQYSSVTELSVESSLLVGRHVYSAFTEFFATFTSVECLHSSDRGLETLVEEDVIAANLFPNLRLLNLSSARFSDDSGRDHLERFLISRVEMGAPITRVDITRCEKNTTKRDLDFLDQFEGMVLVYDENGIETEYVCGSGDTDLLKFHSRARAAASR